jgi:hypothetical protein
LWRLKKICHGHIDIKVKNGKIFALGNWKRITFEQRPLIMQIMHAKNPNFFKNYSDASTINKDAKLTKIKTSEFILSINESLSRSDIEKRIGKSRPTCNRYLNKWRIAGLLEIIGSGPATRYRISQNIEYRGKHE